MDNRMEDHVFWQPTNNKYANEWTSVDLMFWYEKINVDITGRFNENTHACLCNKLIVIIIFLENTQTIIT